MMKLPRSVLIRFGLFTALGLIDLGLTCYLLWAAPNRVYEGNPVARWWLLRCGWVGLAGFKATVVLLVLIAVHRIARSHPHTAARVLAFACGTTALVIGYSCILLGTAHAQGRVFSKVEERNIRAEAARLDSQVRQMHAYYQLRDQLAEDLNAGRNSLDEVVTRLASGPQARNPVWLKSLRLGYPGRCDRERMAALIRYQAHMLKEMGVQTAKEVTGLVISSSARGSREDRAIRCQPEIISAPPFPSSHEPACCRSASSR
jgi:hypothetical protein